jgi:diguanylate cyclase (GGDEF)-like protein
MTDILDNLSEIHDLHRSLTIIQNLNVGVIVLDKNFKVKIWNSFMETKSGIEGYRINDHSIFEFFPNLADSWLKDKIIEAFSMDTLVFSSWEQHKEVFNFANRRPFTGTSSEMMMNFTFIPVLSLTGKCEEVTIIIYDVTDEASSKLSLQAANKKLHELSITDRLTTLYNRGYWEECLKQQYNINRRTLMPITLMMFDIDHFKNVNDTYGHPAGDAVLREVSAILKKQIRSTDIAGRYGGEEFAILLVDANRESAFMVAERIRKAVEAHTVYYEDMVIKFTISLGLCTLSETIPSAQEWLVSTDNCLYFSKEHGRNRTTQYGLNDTEETMNIKPEYKHGIKK